MAHANNVYFRFFDLPGEIRNRIYEDALCCFDPTAPDLAGLERQLAINAYPTGPTGITPATHSVNTALLLTNKQVHREAYDILVKVNQFVHVTTEGYPMSNLLLSSRLPIVTMDRSAASAFEGYVLSVHLVAPSQGWSPEDADMTIEDFDPDIHDVPSGPGIGPFFNFMILGRDLERFCRVLDEGDMYLHNGAGSFPQEGTLTLTLNPTPESPGLSAYKAPLDEFFTDRTQSALLAPFKQHLRGWGDVKIHGPVSPVLVNSIIEVVTSQRSPDPRTIMDELTARKEEANQAYRSGNLEQAFVTWSDLSYEIERGRRSPSAMYLIEREPSFLTVVQEIYFLTNLNLGHLLTTRMQKMQAGTDVMEKTYHLAWFCLREALRLMRDAQFLGTPWLPSIAQVSKLYYRRALCMRLFKHPDLAPQAFSEIDNAFQLSPRSVPILAEKETILGWLREVRGDVPLLRV